ncbi:hypothetical protein CAEBREN_23155 [Caenorhabditis brenneri]|uniref:GH18 domain-containing protein n=1 Tax=Caenorhabditis brenneri TaxID=135651 RepID=G0PJU5_CAEBE|nr:hypothetical protein CAEBREN_23155 [Caenorhabditis brenneri]
MTADLESRLTSQETPVEYVAATGCTVTRVPSVCVKTKKRGSTKGDWINSIVSFILEHQLDGVEIVYRWPETSVDEDNLAFFVRELRYKLEKAEKLAKRKFPYIISIYSRAHLWATKDVPLLDDLLNYVSFFNVETYNFYAPWHVGNIMTGPQSPLYSLGNDNRSIDWTMNAYTCKIMKPSQLNVIIPFGGAYWKNVSKNGAQADDLHFNVGGTRYSGSYYAWRDLETLGFNLTKASWHNVTKTPYIWHSNNRSFLTFDDERSMKEKMEYIISKNLGGVTMDAIDEDDDSHTLLNAVTSRGMCSGPKIGKEEIMYNCNKLA